MPADGRNITVSGHIDRSVQGGGAGSIEIVIFPAYDLSAGQDFSVEGSHDRTVTAECECTYYIVVVVQRMVDDVAMEKAVGSLVCGGPQAVPSVH